MSVTVVMLTTRPATPEDAPDIAHIYNQGIVDRVGTFETRERMRLAQKARRIEPAAGKKWSEEAKLAASARMSVLNQRFRGVPRTEESKAKMSASHTGKKLSDEHREAIRAGHARRKERLLQEGD